MLKNIKLIMDKKELTNHILFPIPSLAICICFIQIIHVAVSASARISLSKPQDDLLFTMFIEQ